MVLYFSSVRIFFHTKQKSGYLFVASFRLINLFYSILTQKFVHEKHSSPLLTHTLKVKWSSPNKRRYISVVDMLWLSLLYKYLDIN
jgi:hypothetical protein